jgi:hypothetical protein
MLEQLKGIEAVDLSEVAWEFIRFRPRLYGWRGLAKSFAQIESYAANDFRMHI